MLKTRVATALALLAVFLPVLFLGPIWSLYILISVVVGCASWEWARILWPNQKFFHVSYAAIIVLMLYGLWFISIDEAYIEVFFVAKLIFLILSFVFWLTVAPMALRQGLHLNLQKWRSPLTLAGFLVFPACWLAIVILRDLGLWVLLTVFIWVWAADIGAYFAGRKFGKKKLASTISPGKTIEGMVGGLVLVVIVAIVSVYQGTLDSNYFDWIYERLSWGGLVVIALAGGLLSVMGDLFESLLKRKAGVKDSSHLLPGHGGFLDRIDALLPVLPFAAIIVLVLSN